jgi:hypothetical protein
VKHFGPGGGTAQLPARDPLAPGDVDEAGQFVLGQAQTETGVTQCNWVDVGFRSHERHPKASRDPRRRA